MGNDDQTQLFGTPRSREETGPNLLHAAIGRCMLVLSVVPRYRHLSLADVSTIIFEPFLRNKVIIAVPSQGTISPSVEQPIALAIWASVSPATTQKIEEQIRSGIFPIRLSGTEWASGEQVWLLDIIAPSQQIATDLFLQLGKFVGRDQIRVHPIIQTIVDPDVFKRMSSEQMEHQVKETRAESAEKAEAAMVSSTVNKLH